jgi:hypothetical protein
MSKLLPLVVAIIVASPAVVSAHHGVAAVGIGYLEGPGAGLETASPLTLPPNHLYLMVKGEHVSFKKYTFAEPQNKDTFDFFTLAVGYGINQYLSVYVCQPYTIKVQDSQGTASGFADIQLMLVLGFKYDDGLSLIPENETLDDLMDWHFSVSLASTIPLGNAVRKDKTGNYFSPDMQNGFGTMSPSIDLAVMKQLNDDFTWLADVSFQYFFEHKYSSIRYQFGAETRFNTSLVYRLISNGRWRMDLIAEASVLNLQRDKQSDESGAVKSLRASGGTIIYATAGIRLLYDRFSASIGAKKAALSYLNESGEQQGSEGLENYRLFVVVGFCFGL